MTKFWKCSKCHGTGKVIISVVGGEHVCDCEPCDGTGNAFVDGVEERHKRRLNEIVGKNPVWKPFP